MRPGTHEAGLKDISALAGPSGWTATICTNYHRKIQVIIVTHNYTSIMV